MSKTITIISAMVFVLYLLSSPLMGQSSVDARRLYNEANALSEKPRSNEDLKKAAQKYEEALGIYRKIGDVKGEGTTLGNLGIVYSDWGQYAKAVEYYEKSLQIKRKIGNVKGESITLNSLGIVYYCWGQYAKAVEYFEKSLGICRKLGDVAGEGQSLMNLGNVYKGWGQYAKAIEYYEKSLEIKRKLGDVELENARFVFAIGEIDKIQDPDESDDGMQMFYCNKETALKFSKLYYPTFWDTVPES
jgi:tetratricopeptide (TPR) repeat protein